MGKSCPLKRLFSSRDTGVTCHIRLQKDEKFSPCRLHRASFLTLPARLSPLLSRQPGRDADSQPFRPIREASLPKPFFRRSASLGRSLCRTFSYRTRAVVTATAMPSPCPGQRQRKKFLPAGQGVPWGRCPSAPGRGSPPRKSGRAQRRTERLCAEKDRPAHLCQAAVNGTPCGSRLPCRVISSPAARQTIRTVYGNGKEQPFFRLRMRGRPQLPATFRSRVAVDARKAPASPTGTAFGRLSVALRQGDPPNAGQQPRGTGKKRPAWTAHIACRLPQTAPPQKTAASARSSRAAFAVLSPPNPLILCGKNFHPQK